MEIIEIFLHFITNVFLPLMHYSLQLEIYILFIVYNLFSSIFIIIGIQGVHNFSRPGSASAAIRFLVLLIWEIVKIVIQLIVFYLLPNELKVFVWMNITLSIISAVILSLTYISFGKFLKMHVTPTQPNRYWKIATIFLMVYISLNLIQQIIIYIFLYGSSYYPILIISTILGYLGILSNLIGLILFILALKPLKNVLLLNNPNDQYPMYSIDDKTNSLAQNRFCMYCGIHIKEEMQYCANCGKRLNNQSN